MATRATDGERDWMDRLGRRVQDRTLFGASSVLILVVSEYLLGDVWGILIGLVIAGAWLLGHTPVAMAVAVIGAVGTTAPADISTLLFATRTTFPNPVLGVGLLGLGLAGLGIEPLVTTRRLTPTTGLVGLLIVIVFIGTLTAAHRYSLSLWTTTAALATITIFVAGALNRATNQLTHVGRTANE